MALVHVVDDDPVTAENIAAVLGREGHELRTFSKPEEALDAARDEAPAVLVTDFAMPGMNGLELVVALRELSPDTTYLVVSGQATVEDAVELMKHRVVDVLVKPPRARALRKSLALALAQHELAAENRRLREALRVRRPLEGVIGTSPAFERVLRLVERAAVSDATVLITGETGSGKEVVAEALHASSPRAEHALVKVHCAAIPETLLEAELFGNARGAFTGAVRDRGGFFERADRGTIFLDEIGEIPLEVQAKLLRVLQDQAVTRLGETRPRRVDVRVVSATHRDLRSEVDAGRFREDLYFRLHVIPVRVPPLRERGDDVLLLARHFFDRERAAQKREDLRALSESARRRLIEHAWPGNVRELDNAIRRAVALATGPEIEASDLPEELGDARRAHVDEGTQSAAGGIVIPRDATLEEAERLLVLNALEAAGGNRRLAAERLGIGQATLYRKLARYQGGEEDA